MRTRSATRAVPDLREILYLMADDIHSARARPVRRRLTQLVAALERARARYAICGTTAMGAHGACRFTEEIDVLVDERDVERVLEELSGSMVAIGQAPQKGPPKEVRLRSRRARSDRPVDIDVLVPIDAVEAWALTTCVRGRAFQHTVDVVSAEALVVMKLRAYASAPDAPRSLQHRADAAWLLQVGTVDMPSIRRFVRSHPDLATELERVLAAPQPRGRLGGPEK